MPFQMLIVLPLSTCMMPVLDAVITNILMRVNNLSVELEKLLAISTYLIIYILNNQ